MSNFDKKNIRIFKFMELFAKILLKEFQLIILIKFKKIFHYWNKRYNAIMLIENFKLNKKWKMRKNYFFIKTMFLRSLEILYQKLLINNNFSKYIKFLCLLIFFFLKKNQIL